MVSITPFIIGSFLPQRTRLHPISFRVFCIFWVRMFVKQRKKKLNYKVRKEQDTKNSHTHNKYTWLENTNPKAETNRIKTRLVLSSINAYSFGKKKEQLCWRWNKSFNVASFKNSEKKTTKKLENWSEPWRKK